MMSKVQEIGKLKIEINTIEEKTKNAIEDLKIEIIKLIEDIVEKAENLVLNGHLPLLHHALVVGESILDLVQVVSALFAFHPFRVNPSMRLLHHQGHLLVLHPRSGEIYLIKKSNISA